MPSTHRNALRSSHVSRTWPDPPQKTRGFLLKPFTLGEIVGGRRYERQPRPQDCPRSVFYGYSSFSPLFRNLICSSNRLRSNIVEHVNQKNRHAWRKTDGDSGPLRPIADHDDWNPEYQADPSQPEWDRRGYMNSLRMGSGSIPGSPVP